MIWYRKRREQKGYWQKAYQDWLDHDCKPKINRLIRGTCVSALWWKHFVSWHQKWQPPENNPPENNPRRKRRKKDSYKTKKLKQDAGAMCRHEHFSNCYPLFLRVLLLITNQNSLLTGHHSHCLLFLFRSGTGIFRCGQKKGCACNDFLYLATLSLFPNL